MSKDEGVQPDFWSYIDNTRPETVQEAVRKQRENGMTWFRCTLVDDGAAWIAGWQERPAIEAPFDPPMTTPTDKP